MSEATNNFQNIPDAWAIPLEEINVLDPVLFENNAHWEFFERLRKEDPVHLNQDDEFGRYWSCLLYTSPSPRDRTRSRMPSSA